MPLARGQVVLDRYVIESLIGQGGMGEVYRARHQKLGMPVAVKTVTNASPDLIQRFAREAMLLARVRHPNVVAILDVGATKDGTECMVMELLEGEGLDARLERKRVLPWSEVRAIGLQILKGLDAIHTAGIVHRDLKPGNVLIAKGTPEVVKLVDFGIAHSAQAAKYTRTGAVIGTPAYMSPEQLVGAELDGRSDLYSLGLMLYELCAGSLPFGDDPTSALRRLREPVPPPRAPAPLPPLTKQAAGVLQSVLAIEAKDRPASARELYSALHAARSAGSTQAQPAAAPVEPFVPQARAGTQVAPQQARPGAAVARGAPRPQGTIAARGVPPPPRQQPMEEPEDYAAYAPAPQPMPMHQPTGYGAPLARAIVAARLPVSRMSREEQRALAQVAAPGRTYHLGGGVWFAVISGQDQEEVAARAGHLAGSLQGRYGDTCKIVWAPASSGFALTPAALSGAAPLPADITRLLELLL